MSCLRWFLLLLPLAGCSSEEPTYAIKGAVTFQSQPVTEGSVQFYDETTGRGAEVDLQPDGTYQAELTAGAYNVIVLPPYIVDNSGGTPNPYYKKVKNIPTRYHSTATSGFIAEVSAEKTTHDFALTP